MDLMYHRGQYAQYVMVCSLMYEFEFDFLYEKMIFKKKKLNLEQQIM